MIQNFAIKHWGLGGASHKNPSFLTYWCWTVNMKSVYCPDGHSISWTHHHTIHAYAFWATLSIEITLRIFNMHPRFPWLLVAADLYQGWNNYLITKVAIPWVIASKSIFVVFWYIVIIITSATCEHNVTQNCTYDNMWCFQLMRICSFGARGFEGTVGCSRLYTGCIYK